MYEIYQGNPDAFIQQMIQSNPSIKQMLDSIQDPNKTFTEMLNKYGITENDFRNLLQ